MGSALQSKKLPNKYATMEPMHPLKTCVAVITPRILKLSKERHLYQSYTFLIRRKPTYHWQFQSKRSERLCRCTPNRKIRQRIEQHINTQFHQIDQIMAIKNYNFSFRFGKQQNVRETKLIYNNSYQTCCAKHIASQQATKGAATIIIGNLRPYRFIIYPITILPKRAPIH